MRKLVYREFAYLYKLGGLYVFKIMKIMREVKKQFTNTSRYAIMY